MNSLLKNILVAAVIVVILFALYLYFFKPAKSGIPEGLATASGQSVNGDAPGQNLLNVLNQVNTLRLDKTLFSKEAFRTLQDFGVRIQDEAIGRLDPFAPLNTPANIAAAPVLNPQPAVKRK